MDQRRATPEKELTTRFPVLYVAFELGNNLIPMPLQKISQVLGLGGAVFGNENHPQVLRDFHMTSSNMKSI